MNLRVQVDSRPFNDAIRAFVDQIGGEVPKVLRNQGRLLFKFIIDRTPPKTLSAGKLIVKSQIGRAIRPLVPSKFKDPSIRKLIRARNFELLSQIIHGRGVVPFSPELHTKARDSKGRVSKDTGWSTPDFKEVKDYIAEVQGRVGQAKGGWAKALMELGGKPSQWIARWASMGIVQANLRDPVNAYIRGENYSLWASHGDDERIVSGAMAARTKAIYTDIEERLKRAAAKAAMKAAT